MNRWMISWFPSVVLIFIDPPKTAQQISLFAGCRFPYSSFAFFAFFADEMLFAK